MKSFLEKVMLKLFLKSKKEQTWMKEREEEANGKAKENLILPSIGLLSKKQTDFHKTQLCHLLFFKSQKD